MAMHRHRKQRISETSLDSLVDIVSNTVGILIILAVFMALFAQLVNPGAESLHGSPPADSVPFNRILVPWSHPTAKNAIYFHMQGNRVFYLDLPAFYRALAEKDPDERALPITVDLPGLTTRYFPVTNNVYCLEFSPDADRGETWIEAQAPVSAWRQALESFPPEKFFYFFWVAGDSFGMFRDVREVLWEQQIEVGWRPARDRAPLEVCNGFDGSSAFQPQ